MKKIFYFMVALATFTTSAQVGIGVSTANIDASAQLEVASTSKGFLAPRMTEAQRNDIASPAAGLLVYQTDGTTGFYYYDGSNWKSGLGAQGIQGLKGDIGLTGETGAKGEQGVQGVQGEQGLAGTPADLSSYATTAALATLENQVGQSSSDISTLGIMLNNKAPLNAPIFEGTATAEGFRTTNGTSSQYLMADGTTSSGNATSVGAISTSSNPNGAAVTAGELNLAPADETNGGIVTTGDQRFSGNKTFDSNLNVIGRTYLSSLQAESGSFNDLNVNSDAFFNGTTFFKGSANFNFVGVDGELWASGLGVFNQLIVNDNVDVNGRLMVIGSADINGRLMAMDGAEIHGNLEVNDNLDVLGNVQFNGNLKVNDNLEVLGNARFGGSFGVDGSLSVSGSANFSSAAFSGDVLAQSFATTSDLRLKKNIAPLEHSLEALMQLNPVSYDKKKSMDSSDYSIKENGFIAQELKKVFPTLVKEGTDSDKLLSVNYTALIPVLTKAIQEQQNEINELKELVKQLINKK